MWFPPDGTDEGVYGESGDSIRAPVHESCLDIAYRVIRRRKPSNVSRTIESRPTSFKELLGAVKYYLPGTAYEGNVVWDNKFYGATDCWSQPWSSRAGTEVGHNLRLYRISVFDDTNIFAPTVICCESSRM